MSLIRQTDTTYDDIDHIEDLEASAGEFVDRYLMRSDLDMLSANQGCHTTAGQRAYQEALEL